VNNRHLEVSTRLPRSLQQREKDVKDLIREHLNRGSLSVSIKIDRENDGASPMSVNVAAARSIHKLLQDLRKTVKLKEEVTLQHLLTFSEIFEAKDESGTDEQEWKLAAEAIGKSLQGLNKMRIQEGKELAKDMEKRIKWMNSQIDEIEKLSRQRIPEERTRLQQRIEQLVSDKNIVDQNRLELEIALMADKLDVTEECVRFRSHTKFFVDAMKSAEPSGRKLNFLVQEINREVNTMGSKSNDTAMAHLVVSVKEELEKIREQVQNIE
jgi:uncharacterized protein (TIGR00255 family)